MGKLIDLTGQRFGRLVVLARAENKGSNVQWLCKCDCGRETTVFGCHLKAGNTLSCGCLHKEVTSNIHSTHRRTNSQLYHIWESMKSRCNNPNNKSYKNYGGRGITICSDWESSFEIFYKWAIANGYHQGLSIDRIDNDKGYAPENCHWVTEKVQSRNRRTNHLLQLHGEVHSIAEWAEIIGIPYGTLLDRIYHGWPIERALTEPIHTEKINKQRLRQSPVT